MLMCVRIFWFWVFVYARYNVYMYVHVQGARRQMLSTAGQGTSTTPDAGPLPPLECPPTHLSSMAPSVGTPPDPIKYIDPNPEN